MPASSPASLLQRKQKMSLSQTYYLAHTARGKLSKEAGRADHDLRLLVGHANLLDGLMLDLADAEREQESWFNETVRKANEQQRHVTWAESLPRVSEESYEEDSDSSDDEDLEDDEDMFESVPASRSVDEDMDIDEDAEEEELQLIRSPSHSSPPELMHESDSESEDEHMPPSPPAPDMPVVFSQKTGNKPVSLSTSPEESFYEEGFYLPQRESITAY